MYFLVFTIAHGMRDYCVVIRTMPSKPMEHCIVTVPKLIPCVRKAEESIGAGATLILATLY